MTISILIRQPRIVQLVPNPSYNPLEPEDGIYNSKKIYVDAVPVLDMDDVAGNLFLALLGVVRTPGRLTGTLIELDTLIAKVESLNHRDLFTQGIHSSEHIAAKFIEIATIARNSNKDLIYV